MNEPERIKIILEFISDNEGTTGTTEYKVEKFMSQNHYCARDTTKRLIYNNLIPNKRVVDKKIGNSFHRLFVNRQNEFNKLIADMNKLEKALNNLNNTVVKRMSMIKSPKTHNLIHLAQLTIYRRITSLVTLIEKNIKSYEDREVLYHKLPIILKASNKLNEIIFPEVFNQALHILKQSGKKKIPGTEGLVYPKFVSEIASIFMDSDSK